MQLTQIITILAVAVAGVTAAPGGHQPPPPPPPSKPTSVVIQQVLSSMALTLQVLTLCLDLLRFQLQPVLLLSKPIWWIYLHGS